MGKLKHDPMYNEYVIRPFTVGRFKKTTFFTRTS